MYDAETNVREFKGLMQYGDGINADMRYATDAKNMETLAGVLQPVAACELMAPTTPKPIETIMRLHRRWYAGDDKDVLIAASDGKLYWMLPGGNSWTQLVAEAFQSNVWSWVTYEINPPGSEASVDVLIISNAKDGMYMIRGDDMTVSPIVTPKKFGVIERYAERIWGGAIDDDPDMLVYSAPYDPTDWSARTVNPEDGAGDISQPSWDGDSFTALRSFGNQLIAFKKTRVWRILGTDPGEYTFREQYGGGAPFEKTIAVDNERIFMLGKDGILVYDGLSVSPFQQQYAEGVWKRLNKNALDQSCAILWKDKYYCAVPLDNSPVNNVVIVFNPVDGTWLVREDISVESFLWTDETLYFTSSETPGQVWKWREDSWRYSPTTASTKWVSPWTDLGAKNVVKGGFEFYLLAEVKGNVTLRVSIQTEKKIKTKLYTVRPLTSQDIQNNKNAKQKKIHFGGAGRRFRFIIESPENSPGWRLISGIKIISEIDPD